MTRGIKLTDEEIEFINQHHDRMFNRQLAKKLGIHANTVKKYKELNNLD